MILPDTSAWIDYLNGADTPARLLLHQAIANDTVIVGDLILVEVLQGIRVESQIRAASGRLAGFETVSLCGPRLAPIAASNFRWLRSKGITVRGTIDIIIATWCLENKASILHNDRDFAAIERLLGLRSYGVN